MHSPTTNVVVMLSFLVQFWLTGCCVPDQCVPENCVWDFLSYVSSPPDAPLADISKPQCADPPPLRVTKAGRKQGIEEIAPLLPTGWAIHIAKPY
jgi:hypothetical protein